MKNYEIETEELKKAIKEKDSYKLFIDLWNNLHDAFQMEDWFDQNAPEIWYHLDIIATSIEQFRDRPL